jgi:hypothetical protein
VAKNVLSSDNPQVQRAAVQLLTNLVNCNWVRTKLRGVDAEQRVAAGEKVTVEEHRVAVERAPMEAEFAHSEDLKLLLAFATSDDHDTAAAATGALAMICNDPLIARRVAVTEVVSFVPIGDDSAIVGEEEKKVSSGATEALTSSSSTAAIPPTGSRTVRRTGMSILRALARSSNADVTVRVNVALQEIDQLQPRP